MNVKDQVHQEISDALNIWGDDTWEVKLELDDNYDDTDEEHGWYFAGELIMESPFLTDKKITRYFPFRMNDQGIVEFDTHEDSWEPLNHLYAALFYNEVTVCE